jgi:error-prone DNA polymerase
LIRHLGAAAGLPAYAELFCLSNFSFLQGASHAEELVDRAVQLGYAALALTDECSLAGVVRAHAEAKRAALPLIVGAHFHLRIRTRRRRCPCYCWRRTATATATCPR